MAIMADVDELCYIQHEHQRLIRKQVMPVYLVCYPIVIDIKITRDVHVDEVIVQRLPSSGIGTIWHISVIPVVDILHSLTLIWGVILGTGTVKVDLDKFGQMVPAVRRASIPH
jgi:hypothetical protein